MASDGVDKSGGRVTGDWDSSDFERTPPGERKRDQTSGRCLR